MRFDGKVVIITGGSSGIGLAAATHFAREGAKVLIMARNEARGREAVAELAKTGVKVLFVPGDASVASDCRHCVDVAVATYGRLDILFNNAGILYVDRDVVASSEDEWDATIAAGLKSVFLMSKYAVPHIAAAGGGSIINNSSIFGLVGGTGVAAYCAAKGGVISLTKAMALDHAAQNIRVNCVCPGSVQTAMLEKEMEDQGGIKVELPKYAARHPLNRISSPEEVAAVVAFLDRKSVV